MDLDERELIVRKGCGSGWKGVNREEGCGSGWKAVNSEERVWICMKGIKS